MSRRCVVYTPSRYFASEPKADVSVVLRNPKAMDSAKNQVMFALNDYLAGIALDQLSNQAAVGGSASPPTPITV
jgi:protease-3